MTAQLTQRHGLPFKTAYNNTRGFYIQLYVGPGSDPQYLCNILSVCVTLDDASTRTGVLMCQ